MGGGSIDDLSLRSQSHPKSPHSSLRNDRVLSLEENRFSFKVDEGFLTLFLLTTLSSQPSKFPKNPISDSKIGSGVVTNHPPRTRQV